MRGGLRIIIVLTAMLALSGRSFGDELIEVTASVDKQTAYIGDLIDYTITITYDSTIRLTPPAVGANLGGFDVKDYHAGDEKAIAEGRFSQEIRFSLRTFTTGDYVIPPLPIEYMTDDSTLKYISADPIKIVIKSLLGEGAEADTLELRPLKGQVSLAAGRKIWYYIVIAAVVLAAATAVYIIRRRRHKAAEEEYVDPRPAWEIAFTELALLKERDLPGSGEVKLFYLELSEIFRNFLGRQFGFDAIDMTTEEIAGTLADLAFNPELGEEISEFLGHADLVKFAKYVPSAERPYADWDVAYGLVDRSRDIILTAPAVVEPEPVMAGIFGEEKREYSDLDYAPPELRDSSSSNSEEDSP